MHQQYAHKQKLDFLLSDFLMCFPINYRDFSVNINGENNSEITIFIFTVYKNGIFMNFRLKVLPKRYKM